jgi:hypothetical protein
MLGILLMIAALVFSFLAFRKANSAHQNVARLADASVSLIMGGK